MGDSAHDQWTPATGCRPEPSVWRRPPGAGVTIFRIDPHESRVWISGRSSLHAIDSQSDSLTGMIDIAVADDGRLDPGPVRASVEFPVTRLRSSNPLEQRELHRRIDAKRFPVIRGEVESIVATHKAAVYTVTGTVSFRGVTQRHSDPMTIELDRDGSLRLAGRSTFDIRDYGMEPPRILMLKVEPLVAVRVEIVARPDA